MMFDMGYIHQKFWHDDPDASKHTYWYRFEDKRYSVCLDEYGDRFATSIEVHMYRLRVIKETPTGAWLAGCGHARRFCKKDCRRRFAAPTIELARESFIARKQKQISIYEHRIAQAKEAIVKAKR